MSNQFHNLAVMAKLMNPDEARSLEELETYFRALQSASPFALAVQTECAALDQEVIDAEERADMVQHAEQCIDARTAAGSLPDTRSELHEYLEVQLESNFPDVSEAAVRDVIDQVTANVAANASRWRRRFRTNDDAAAYDAGVPARGEI